LVGLTRAGGRALQFNEVSVLVSAIKTPRVTAVAESSAKEGKRDEVVVQLRKGDETRRG